MSENHLLGFQPDEIDDILVLMKNAVRAGRFIVSMNPNTRADNYLFLTKYNLTTADIAVLLCSLSCDEFVHAVNSTNMNYPQSILYVFVKSVVLFDATGNQNNEDVYIKFDLTQKQDGDYVVVVSIHPAKGTYQYLFLP